MSNISLRNLLYKTPTPTVMEVQNELSKVFPWVYTLYKNEPFFNYRLCCLDANDELRLVVKYGWSFKTNGWIYECEKIR